MFLSFPAKFCQRFRAIWDVITDLLRILDKFLQNKEKHVLYWELTTERKLQSLRQSKGRKTTHNARLIWWTQESPESFQKRFRDTWKRLWATIEISSNQTLETFVFWLLVHFAGNISNTEDILTWPKKRPTTHEDNERQKTRESWRNSQNLSNLIKTEIQSFSHLF